MRTLNAKEAHVVDIIEAVFDEWVEGYFSLAVAEGERIKVFRAERLPDDEMVIFFLHPNWIANDQYEICGDILDEEECEEWKKLKAEGYDFESALEKMGIDYRKRLKDYLVNTVLYSEEYDNILSVIEYYADG